MALSKYQRRLRIRKGVRRKVAGTSEKPRLSVYKSNRRIYAQIIDDIKGHTLAFATSAEISSDNQINIKVSEEVGKKIAEKAVSEGISQVIFDRSGYRYHGRIKALADAARQNGLKF